MPKRVETKTRNKRYQKTEIAILEALMKSRELPSTGELVRRARISRSTLYRHHRTVPGIVPDYEREVLRKYANVLRKLNRQKNVQMKSVYLRTLVFVVTERRTFEILLKYDGGAVVEKMIFKLRGRLKDVCHLPKNSDKMLRIYAKEVAGVIEEWGGQGFKEDEINAVLGKVLFLTKGLKQRLGPLNY